MAVNAVYQSLLQHCRPFQMDGPWHFEITNSDCFECPTDDAEVLARLLADHSAETLLEAGVAEQLDNGLALSGQLIGSGKGLIALRCSPEAPPYALLTETGSVPHATVAAMAACDDDFTYRCLEQFQRRLFLASSIEDAMLLRALQMPAATTTGFEQITIEELGQLGRLCATRQQMPPETEIQSDLIVELVLVGWSPAQLSSLYPTRLVAVAERLRALEWNAGVDVSNVAVWLPSPNELARLQFFLRNQDAKQAVEVFWGSADKSLFQLEAVGGDLNVASHPGFLLTRQRLSAALDQPAVERDPAVLDQLRRTYEAAVDGDLVGPMLEQAFSTADPARRSLEIALAEQSGIIHKHLPFVGRGIEGTASYADVTKMLREQRAAYRELRR